jgi:hypothetical protein
MIPNLAATVYLAIEPMAARGRSESIPPHSSDAD